MDAVSDDMYAGALAVILDCGGASLISDTRYSLAKTTVRLDHHLFTGRIADTEVIRPEYESCCGIVTALAMEAGFTLDKTTAKALFTGMVTDSGRFRYESVTGETLRLAAMLMDMGIDLERLYANLYLSEYEELKYHSFVLNKMRLTKNGVAHFYISLDAQKKFGLTAEQACEAVSYLGGLKGSIIWLAFIENADGTVRVRLRSRFVTVNKLAEKYGGGGHACASGATLKNRYGIRKVLADADGLIAEYKANNTDWM